MSRWRRAPFFCWKKTTKKNHGKFHVAFVVEHDFIVFNDLPSLKLTYKDAIGLPTPPRSFYGRFTTAPSEVAQVLEVGVVEAPVPGAESKETLPRSAVSRMGKHQTLLLPITSMYGI